MAASEAIELELLVPKPFLLLRTSGLQWLDPICQQIATMGLCVEDELCLDNFEELAKRLYPVREDTPNSYLWLMFSREFLGEASNTAHAFTLNSQHLDDYESITEAKKAVQEAVGLTRFLVKYKGRNIDTHLHHIHAPDYDEALENVQYEFSLLMHYHARRNY